MFFSGRAKEREALPPPVRGHRVLDSAGVWGLGITYLESSENQQTLAP